MTADTVVSLDMLVLQQGQWEFGQIGFLPTLQALIVVALQKLRRQQQQKQGRMYTVSDLQDRQMLNVQRFSAAYLSQRAAAVFQEEVPTLQPNLNLKFPLSHRLAMIGCLDREIPMDFSRQ